MAKDESVSQVTSMKTAFEIEALAGQLNLKNQAYVLNTINTLLFAQQSAEEFNGNILSTEK
jgi:hypothetical protein